MVFSDRKTDRERRRRVQEEEEQSLMETGPERSSKPLHNFTLPYLKWCNQRHLRCMKINDSSTTVADHRPSYRSPPFKMNTSSSSVVNRRESDCRGSRQRLGGTGRGVRERSLLKSGMEGGGRDDGEGIGAAREKIMNNFKTAACKMKDAILREEEVSDDEKEEPESLPSPPVAAAAPVQSNSEVRPWNLRTRRAACKALIGGGLAAASSAMAEERRANHSPIRSEVGNNSPRLLRGDKEMKERPKFSLNLSKKEIEEDYMKMLGHRPPRRPKKRPRAVQKQLDSLFPGLWLTEVTADTYKVPEEAEKGKR